MYPHILLCLGTPMRRSTTIITTICALIATTTHAHAIMEGDNGRATMAAAVEVHTKDGRVLAVGPALVDAKVGLVDHIRSIKSPRKVVKILWPMALIAKIMQAETMGILVSQR